MKINPLNVNTAKNNNINFKRAFEVKINSFSYHFEYGFKPSKTKIQTPAHDFVDILRNKPVEKYDNETAQKIARFIKREVKDANPKQGGVFSRIIDGRFCIFTGEEAKKAREIIAKSKKEKEELDLKYLEGPKEGMSPSELIVFRSPERFYKLDSQNIGIRRDKALLEMIEDGEYKKPDTKVNLVIDNNKIKEIDYNYFHMEKIDSEKKQFNTKKVSKTLRV